MSLMNKWWETEAGKHITTKKYLHEGETFNDFVCRVRSIFSTDELKDKMGDALYSAEFFPAGRSLYGAGSKGKFKASMSNCYIIDSPSDNIESIFDTAKKMARIYSFGGGVGVNISNLRPNESRVNNSAQTSSGAVSFMELYNTVGKIIGASNKKKGETSARRAALMIGLNCDHPDLEEFLDIKKNNTEIQSANISILFTDEFMNAVKNNQEYTLSFKTEHEFIMKNINAREFFMKFSKNNHSFAEPGAIFIDNVRKHHLLSSYPEEEYTINIPNP